MKKQATFSEDRTRRFELIRDWGDELFISAYATVNFIMLNPSVADSEKDDPTIRKCMGFAKRWGFSRIVVTNLIPIVSTDPWGLPPWSGIDMKNRAILQKWLGAADLIVAAWGSQPRALARTIAIAEHIYLLGQTAPVDLYCIGVTKNGDPLHPSRAPYTDRPVLWGARIP
jgi:hypothetical protein